MAKNSTKNNLKPQKTTNSNKVKKVVKPTKVKKVQTKKTSKILNHKKKVVKKNTRKPVSVKSPKTVSKSVTPLIISKKNQKKPKAVKTQGSGPKGYTAVQYQKFLSQKKTLEGCTNQQLKDILRKNLQSMSGNKDDLIYKVADGMILGRIPRCPNCFGGRPKFDFKAGTYYCSGYRDDEDFKNCHSTFQLSDIKRDPWEWKC